MFKPIKYFQAVVRCGSFFLMLMGICLLCGCGTDDAAKENAISDTKSEQTVATEEQSVTTEIREVSTEEKNDYEDETRISQLITVGELDIDIYQADTLLYFYHPNEESGYQEGADFVFSSNGTLGDQKIMIGSFGNQQTYTMVLTSNGEQITQIGIYNQGDDYVSALSDLQMKKGDVVRIEYSKEDSKVYLNDLEIDFKKEGNKVIGTQ